MAKDDYDVVVFKILLYYYAIFKGTILFNETEFKRAIKYDSFADGYLERVLKLMSEENLIDEVYVSKAWGNQFIVFFESVQFRNKDECLNYEHGMKFREKNKNCFCYRKSEHRKLG